MPSKRPNVFSAWATTTKINPESYIAPAEYVDCWHSALARLCLALNHKWAPRGLPLGLLRKDDEEVVEHFRRVRTSVPYYLIVRESIDEHLLREALQKDDIATNFFYGSFRYLSANGGASARVPTKRIVYNLRDGFLDYSYKGLHVPRRHSDYAYTATELGEAAGVYPGKLMARCATNYLLRNFWHNVTHDVCQGITGVNYGDFPGRAREESDFEADALSLIFLCYSYGLPIFADSVTDTLPNSAIVHVLRRNRCNEMFGDRAKDRRIRSTFDEREFRICRSIAGYVSGWLVARGLTASMLTVHAIGYMVYPKRRPAYRDGEGFAVSVNGYRIAHQVAYPFDGTPAERAGYFRDLASSVQTQYATALRKNRDLREHARLALAATYERLGVVPR